MITQPKILEYDSNEYFLLKIACQIFEELTNNMNFKIEDIYFDIGQNWKWITIIAYNLIDNNSFQALYPREWADIISSTNNSQIREICKNIINRYPTIWNVN